MALSKPIDIPGREQEILMRVIPSDYVYEWSYFLSTDSSHPAMHAPYGKRPIDLLPFELVLEILNFVSFSDKKTLAFVDRRFRVAVRAHLLEAVHFEHGVPLSLAPFYVPRELAIPTIPVPVVKSVTIAVNDVHDFLGGRIDGSRIATCVAWPGLEHVKLDLTRSISSAVRHLAKKFVQGLFPGVKSLVLMGLPPRSNGTDFLVMLKGFTGVTGLGLSVECPPQDNISLLFASRFMHLTTLHIAKSQILDKDAGQIASMFPCLKTLILEGGRTSVNEREKLKKCLVRVATKLQRLETLVFPMAGRQHFKIVLSNLINASETLKRIVIVRHPDASREYESRIVVVDRNKETNKTGRVEDFKDLALCEPACQFMVCRSRENIYSREFKWAVGAWKEGPVLPRK